MMAVPLLCLAGFTCILWIVLLKIENAQLKSDSERIKKRLKSNVKQMTKDVSLQGGAAMSRGDVGVTDERIGTGRHA
jgi:hypothetical protein